MDDPRTPHEIRLHIARLVIDGSLADAAAWARDPAGLGAAIAAQLSIPDSSSGSGWTGSVAAGVANRLSASGVNGVPGGDAHGPV